MEKPRTNGKCLCGSVSISVLIEHSIFDACHCNMCRKWSGGPALCVDAGKDIVLKGEEFISTYDSSDWAQRGFCKKCGTHLFYKLKNGQLCNVPLGLLDGTDHFKFQMQIFYDYKPISYEFANATGKMTEAEVFAKYAPPHP